MGERQPGYVEEEEKTVEAAREEVVAAKNIKGKERRKSVCVWRKESARLKSDRTRTRRKRREKEEHENKDARIILLDYGEQCRNKLMRSKTSC